MCCIPEVESLALMPSLWMGFSMSFQVFGACSGLTLELLYEMPAKVTPIQVKWPAGVLWYGAL